MQIGARTKLDIGIVCDVTVIVVGGQAIDLERSISIGKQAVAGVAVEGIDPGKRDGLGCERSPIIEEGTLAKGIIIFTERVGARETRGLAGRVRAVVVGR